MLDFIHTLNPLYSLSGLFIGALVGFTGVGGGSLMTPLLVLLFGIHPATAVGADSDEAGRLFRFQAGHRSDAKPASIPI